MPTDDVTLLLRHASSGDAESANRLMGVVYDELRALADRQLRGENPGHTLQATALAHEAYLRLIDQRNTDWKDRQHFLSLAARMIRRILVDHARAKRAAKRGGQFDRVDMDSGILEASAPSVDLMALDEALEALAALNARQAKIVELRFFGGLTIDEVARIVDLSPRMVDIEWSMARAWLKKTIEGD